PPLTRMQSSARSRSGPAHFFVSQLSVRRMSCPGATVAPSRTSAVSLTSPASPRGVFIEASSQSALRFWAGAGQSRSQPWSGAFRSPAAGDTSVSTNNPAQPNPNAPALIRPRISGTSPAGPFGPSGGSPSQMSALANARGEKVPAQPRPARRRRPAAMPIPPATSAPPAPSSRSRLCGPVRGSVLTGAGAGAGAGSGAATPAAARAGAGTTTGAAVVETAVDELLLAHEEAGVDGHRDGQVPLVLPVFGGGRGVVGQHWDGGV